LEVFSIFKFDEINIGLKLHSLNIKLKIILLEINNLKELDRENLERIGHALDIGIKDELVEARVLVLGDLKIEIKIVQVLNGCIFLVQLILQR
jgi:hypothetical protein